MSVRRSTEDLSTAGTTVSDTICSICNSVISNKSDSMQTVCKHIFHKICINNYVRTKPTCPICGVKITKDSTSNPLPSTSQKPLSPMMLRSSSKARSFDAGRSTEITSAPANQRDVSDSYSTQSVNVGNIKDIVSSVVSEQQSQLLSTLTTQMSRLIETQIEASISRLHLANIPRNVSVPMSTSHTPVMQTLPDVEQRTFEQLLGLPGAAESRLNISHGPDMSQTGNALNRSDVSGSNTASDLLFRPDKVSQIMLNWRLKFSGTAGGLTVDKFIYRVEALTKQTLGGNFSILCGNAAVLFDGKANDWFWRFHEYNANFQWSDLCRSLRQQYQDSRTDIDIREMIRDRKQRANETFDTFYESVLELVDRLHEPLSDRTLVEILRRNLLPEIQHEILNISVDSVSQLRGICRRREFFLQDMRRKHGINITVTKSNQFHKRLSEVKLTEEPEPEVLQYEEDVSEISLMCWNCREPGHRYHDCVAERTIFCYGCGTPQVYKPNCLKCCKNSKNLPGVAPQSAVKPKMPH